MTKKYGILSATKAQNAETSLIATRRSAVSSAYKIYFVTLNSPDCGASFVDAFQGLAAKLLPWIMSLI